jgi:hypothetical protein
MACGTYKFLCGGYTGLFAHALFQFCLIYPNTQCYIARSGCYGTRFRELFTARSKSTSRGTVLPVNPHSFSLVPAQVATIRGGVGVGSFLLFRRSPSADKDGPTRADGTRTQDPEPTGPRADGPRAEDQDVPTGPGPRADGLRAD